MTDPGPLPATSSTSTQLAARRASQTRRLVAVAVVAVLLVAAAAFGVSRLVPSGAAQASSAVLEVGAPAPDLAGTTLDGRHLSLADLRGKPVIVNFWASWCVPCKQEFPAFKSALVRHQADGLTVLGVLFNDGAAPARAFVAQEGARWPTLLDPNGSAAKTFEVLGAPESFLVDRSGVVRARILGTLTDSGIDQAIAPILR